MNIADEKQEINDLIWRHREDAAMHSFVQGIGCGMVLAVIAGLAGFGLYKVFIY